MTSVECSVSGKQPTIETKVSYIKDIYLKEYDKFMSKWNNLLASMIAVKLQLTNLIFPFSINMLTVFPLKELHFIFYGCVCTPFVQAALFSPVCCVLSVFRLFVHKPMRLTMPVCVLSCAYCCHCVSVPRLASTRCKAETITANRVPCICTGLTPWPFLLPFNTPSSSSSPAPPPPPLTFDLSSKDGLACHVRTRQGLLPAF